jgi:hypothetical protein
MNVFVYTFSLAPTTVEGVETPPNLYPSIHKPLSLLCTQAMKIAKAKQKNARFGVFPGVITLWSDTEKADVSCDVVTVTCAVTLTVTVT